MDLIWRDLHNRTLEVLARPHEVVEGGEQDDETSHEATEVHRHGSHRRRVREETKEKDNDAKDHTEGIDDGAKDSRDVEGAPDQLRSLRGLGGDFVLVANHTLAAAPEQKTLSDQV